mmetsp:Transcript_24477/g.35094  ORF Transcript_24477/g.35094 Transcript_24477/m.35094 type:complete len:126 (+) Transcript_24477:563-940(+)
MQDIGNTRPLVTNESGTMDSEIEVICVGNKQRSGAVTPVVEQDTPKKKPFPSVAALSQEAVDASLKLSTNSIPNVTVRLWQHRKQKLQKRILLLLYLQLMPTKLALDQEETSEPRKQIQTISWFN